MRTKTTTFVLGLLASCLVCAVTAQGRERASGFCEQGGTTITFPGLGAVAQKVQGNFPNCKVEVFLSGTLTLATLYSDNLGTPKANPFTADSITGAWFFYSDDGRYDVRFSGGGIVTPFTRSDLKLMESQEIVANVVVLGAKCDGVTNDAPAYQLGLNAVGLRGGVIYTPPSATPCVIGSPLTLPKSFAYRNVAEGAILFLNDGPW